jgi:iron complex transport system permease protein
MSRNPNKIFFPILLALGVLAFYFSISTGVEKINLLDVLNLSSRQAGEVHRTIFYQLRLPRTVLAFMAGAALSVSGMVFQAMFRNPLATPFTLGVSSGAALGAVLGMMTASEVSFAGVPTVSLFSFAGALFTMLLVYSIAKTRGGFSISSVLLAGVAINFSFSALILFVQYLSDFSRSFKIMRWLMGNLDVVGYSEVLQILPFWLAGVPLVFFLRYDLNTLLSGDELAQSRGVDVARKNVLAFFGVSLLTGAVVAVTGPIGFVGMMMPHIMRSMLGTDHVTLIPASILAGGIFLTVCDTLARSLVPPIELPVGILTALTGGPFFIGLLIANRKREIYL